MTSARTVRWVTVATTTLYTLILLASGVQVSDGAKKLVSFIPSVIAVALLVLDKWAWKWPGVHRLTGRPRIDGTWRLTIKPSDDSLIPPGGNRGPIDAFAIIEQTLWTVHVTQVTRESTSTSAGAVLRPVDGSQQKLLVFSYTNEPRAEHQPRSPQHQGACTFRCTGRLPRTMDGGYFTGRLTRGDLQAELLDRSTDLLRYDELAQRHGAVQP